MAGPALGADAPPANGVAADASVAPADEAAAREEAGHEVILRAELCTDAGTRNFLHVVSASFALAFCALVVLLCFQIMGFLETIEDTHPLLLFNAVLGGMQSCALAIGLLALAVRVGLAWKAKGVWTLRRARAVGLAAFEASAMLLLSVAYVLPNVYVLSRHCSYFDAIVPWCQGARSFLWVTIFASFSVRVKMNLLSDGSRADGILLDNPRPLLCLNLYIFIYWVAYVVVDFNLARNLADMNERVTFDCMEGGNPCGRHRRGVTTQAIMKWGFPLFFMVYAGRGAKAFYRKSYNRYRWAFVLFRYQCQTIGTVFAFTLIALTLFSVQTGSNCTHYAITWFGNSPAQFVTTMLMMVNLLLFMPAQAKKWAHPKHRISRSTDGALVWSETECLEVKRHNGRDTDDWEPAFCFETAVKLYYWCILPYRYDPKTGKGDGFSKDLAMDLYGFKNLEYVGRDKMDMHCFVGWKQGLLLVTFRGTKSVKNLLSDANVLRVPQQTNKGSQYLGYRPMVHKGFFKCWRHDGFREAVLGMVKGLIDRAGPDPLVILTGHSMGGAVAMLAAVDVRQKLNVPKRRLMCYTYGAPRLGNSIFIDEFLSEVPDFWQVMNNMDAITDVPKFMILYKHTNNKVLINPDGRLIVRPLMSENRLLAMGRRRTIADHMLPSYRKSLAAVVRSQFIKHRGLEGGAEGVCGIFAGARLAELLDLEQDQLNEIGRLGSGIWIQEKEMKRKLRRQRLERLVLPCRCLLARCCGGREGDVEDGQVGCLGARCCLCQAAQMPAPDSVESYDAVGRSSKVAVDLEAGGGGESAPNVERR